MMFGSIVRTLGILFVASVAAIFSPVIGSVPSNSDSSQTASREPVSELSETDILTAEKLGFPDAAFVAADQAITVEEAAARLATEAKVAKAESEIASLVGETYAGLWIEHDPEFKVKVAATEEIPKKSVHTIDSMLGITAEVRIATHSLTDLEDIRSSLDPQVMGLKGIFAGSSIDIPNNKYVIETLNKQAISTVLDRVDIPRNAIKVVPADKLATLELNIAGGVGLKVPLGREKVCTAGFIVVRNSARLVSSAGHCPVPMQIMSNDVMLNGAARKLKDQYDVRVMYAHSSHTLLNRIYISPQHGSRTITGSVTRLSQPVGSTVCNRGIATGYKCTSIKTRSYLPVFANDPSPSRTAHYVQTNAHVTAGGDSGGPWFAGNYAYGIHTGGGAGINSIYMAINYLSGVDAQVATS